MTNHTSVINDKTSQAMNTIKTSHLMRELSITSREFEVLLLIAKGESNKKIAQSLGVNNRTIDKHLENIFKKLKVNNRTAAAIFMNKNMQ